MLIVDTNIVIKILNQLVHIIYLLTCKC